MFAILHAVISFDLTFIEFASTNAQQAHVKQDYHTIAGFTSAA